MPIRDKIKRKLRDSLEKFLPGSPSPASPPQPEKPVVVKPGDVPLHGTKYLPPEVQDPSNPEKPLHPLYDFVHLVGDQTGPDGETQGVYAMADGKSGDVTRFPLAQGPGEFIVTGRGKKKEMPFKFFENGTAAIVKSVGKDSVVVEVSDPETSRTHWWHIRRENLSQLKPTEDRPSPVERFTPSNEPGGLPTPKPEAPREDLVHDLYDPKMPPRKGEALVVRSGGRELNPLLDSYKTSMHTITPPPELDKSSTYEGKEHPTNETRGKGANVAREAVPRRGNVDRRSLGNEVHDARHRQGRCDGDGEGPRHASVRFKRCGIADANRRELIVKRALPKWKEEGVELPDAFARVEQYVDQPGVFFSMTALEKFGINPSSNYNTPLGIYAYPLNREYFKLWQYGKLPFVGDQPYINIFKTNGAGVIDVASDEYTEDDLKRDVNKLRRRDFEQRIQKIEEAKKELFDRCADVLKAVSELGIERHIEPLTQKLEAVKRATEVPYVEALDEITDAWNNVALFIQKVPGVKEQEVAGYEASRDLANLMHRGMGPSQQTSDKWGQESKSRRPFGKLWNVTRMMNEDPKKWNSSLRSLGVNGVTDLKGTGLIHENEPTQAVFFSTKGLTLLGRFDNPQRSTNKEKSRRDTTRVLDAMRDLDFKKARVLLDRIQIVPHMLADTIAQLVTGHELSTHDTSEFLKVFSDKKPLLDNLNDNLFYKLQQTVRNIGTDPSTWGRFGPRPVDEMVKWLGPLVDRLRPDVQDLYAYMLKEAQKRETKEAALIIKRGTIELPPRNRTIYYQQLIKKMKSIQSLQEEVDKSIGALPEDVRWDAGLDNFRTYAHSRNIGDMLWTLELVFKPDHSWAEWVRASVKRAESLLTDDYDGLKRIERQLENIDLEKISRAINDWNDYYKQEPIKTDLPQLLQRWTATVQDLRPSLQDFVQKGTRDVTHYHEERPPPHEKTETLYHASANAKELAAKGFSKEMPERGGIGGSQSTKDFNVKGVSFTSDLYVAKEIARSLKEVIAIANGEIKWHQVERWISDAGLDPVEVAKNANIRSRRKPEKYREKWDNWGSAKANKDDPAAVFGLYRAYMLYASTKNKRYDPLYFNVSINTFKGLDPANVGVVKATVDMTDKKISYAPAMQEYRVPPASISSVDGFIGERTGALVVRAAPKWPYGDASRSDEGSALLDEYQLGSDWNAGGCVAMAKALQKRLGGKLYYVVMNGTPQHVVLKKGDLYFDVDGPQTEKRLLRRWQRELNVAQQSEGGLTCQTCNGSGEVDDDVCGTCEGSGLWEGDIGAHIEPFSTVQLEEFKLSGGCLPSSKAVKALSRLFDHYMKGPNSQSGTRSGALVVKAGSVFDAPVSKLSRIADNSIYDTTVRQYMSQPSERPIEVWADEVTDDNIGAVDFIDGHQPQLGERFYWINDGHHRAEAAHKMGQATIKAYRIDVLSQDEVSSLGNPYVRPIEDGTLWHDKKAYNSYVPRRSGALVVRAMQRQARTLWHGTSKDNAASIAEHGLIPQVGPFVENSYGCEFGGEEGEEFGSEFGGGFDTTFATDKREMGSALGGIIASVAHKLGKNFHDVTDAEIVEHGALVKIEAGDESMQQRPGREAPQKEQDAWERAQSYGGDEAAPPTVEPSDWWSRENVGTDAVITGSAMIRVLRQYGAWPRRWGPKENESSLSKGQRELLIKHVRLRHPDVSAKDAIEKIDSLAPAEMRQAFDSYVPYKRGALIVRAAARTYWRVQPAGKPLLGHTSDMSDQEDSCPDCDGPHGYGDDEVCQTCAGEGVIHNDSLPKGYVFAYTDPNFLDTDWGAASMWDAGSEVVIFRGTNAYNPGDFEGVAVVPTRILKRVPLDEWIRRHDVKRTSALIVRAALSSDLSGGEALRQELAKDAPWLSNATEVSPQEAKSHLSIMAGGLGKMVPYFDREEPVIVRQAAGPELVERLIKRWPHFETFIQTLAKSDPTGNLRWLDWGVKQLRGGASVEDILGLWRIFFAERETLGEPTQFKTVADAEKFAQEKIHSAESSGSAKAVFNKGGWTITQVFNREALWRMSGQKPCRWCVGWESEDYWNSYMEDGRGELYFIKGPSPTSPYLLYRNGSKPDEIKDRGNANVSLNDPVHDVLFQSGLEIERDPLAEQWAYVEASLSHYLEGLPGWGKAYVLDTRFIGVLRQVETESWSEEASHIIAEAQSQATEQGDEVDSSWLDRRALIDWWWHDSTNVIYLKDDLTRLLRDNESLESLLVRWLPVIGEDQQDIEWLADASRMFETLDTLSREEPTFLALLPELSVEQAQQLVDAYDDWTASDEDLSDFSAASWLREQKKAALIVRANDLDLAPYEREWQEGKTLDQDIAEVEFLLRTRGPDPDILRVHDALLMKRDEANGVKPTPKWKRWFGRRGEALVVTAFDKSAVLRQRHNDKTGKTEWALVSPSSGQVLKWFGTKKPSDEAVKKEDRRVQYFKHKDGALVVRAASKPKSDPLVAVHNLSANNLVHADEVGGLIAPSIAITKASMPFDSFGEVTLVAPMSMVDPATTPVFDADIYSSRYPGVRYKPNTKEIDKFRKQYEDQIKRTESYYGDVHSTIEDKGHEGLLDRNSIPPLQLAFLEQVKGLKIPTPTREKLVEMEWARAPSMKKFFDEHGYAHNARPPAANNPDGEYWKNLSDASRAAIQEYWNSHPDESFDEQDRKDMIESEMKYNFGPEDAGMLHYNPFDKILRSHQNIGKTETDKYGFQDELNKLIKPYQAEFEVWAKQRLKPLQGDRYLTTEGGKKLKYSPENVLRLMTKKLKGGESFNYGMGSLRALGANRFKSLEHMDKAKDKIVSSEEFDSMKKANEERFFELLNKLKPYHAASDDFRFSDTLISSLGESYKRGRSLWQELKKDGFQGVPADIVQELAAFRKDLVNMPTEYFEAKPQRIIGLREFAGAAVPKDIAQSVIDTLMSNGLHVEMYNKKKPGSRMKAVLKVQKARKSAAISTYDAHESPLVVRAGILEPPPAMVEKIRDICMQAGRYFAEKKLQDMIDVQKALPSQIKSVESNLVRIEETIKRLYYGEQSEIDLPQLNPAKTDSDSVIIWRRPQHASAPGLYGVGLASKEDGMYPQEAVDLPTAIEKARGLLKESFEEAKYIQRASEREGWVKDYETKLIELDLGGHSDVQPSKSRDFAVYADIPLDFKGSRYESLMDPKKTQDTITVYVYATNHADKAGEWNDASNELSVWLGTHKPQSEDEVKRLVARTMPLVQHEVAHVAQTYLGLSRGLTRKNDQDDWTHFQPAGLPSRLPSQRKKNPNEDPNDHDLEHEERLVEFYPNIISELGDFNEWVKRFEDDTSSKNLKPRKDLARRWVNTRERFEAVKKHDPSRWRKMVTEFFKAVDDSEPVRVRAPGWFQKRQDEKRRIEKEDAENFNKVTNSTVEKILQMAFTRNRAEMIDSGYKTWKQWVQARDAEDLAIVVDNDSDVYEKYLSKLPQNFRGEAPSTEQLIERYKRQKAAFVVRANDYRWATGWWIAPDGERHQVDFEHAAWAHAYSRDNDIDIAPRDDFEDTGRAAQRQLLERGWIRVSGPTGVQCLPTSGVNFNVLLTTLKDNASELDMGQAIYVDLSLGYSRTVEVKVQRPGQLDSKDLNSLKSMFRACKTASTPLVVRASMVKTARALYHGTTREATEQIRTVGLKPQVGAWVEQAYGGKASPLVFAADKSEMWKVVAAVAFQVGQLLGQEIEEVTDDEIIEYGAVVRMKEGNKTFEHSPGGDADDNPVYYDETVADMTELEEKHPSVESGDWFSDKDSPVDAVYVGRKMVDLLRRNGAWPRTWGPDRKKNIEDRYVEQTMKTNPSLEDLGDDPDEPSGMRPADLARDYADAFDTEELRDQLPDRPVRTRWEPSLYALQQKRKDRRWGQKAAALVVRATPIGDDMDERYASIHVVAGPERVKVLKEKYPSLSFSIDELAADDPTGGQQKYLDWGVRMLQRSGVTSVAAAIRDFEMYRQYFPKGQNDINKYKSPDELDEAIQRVKEGALVEIRVDNAKAHYGKDYAYAIREFARQDPSGKQAYLNWALRQFQEKKKEIGAAKFEVLQPFSPGMPLRPGYKLIDVGDYFRTDEVGFRVETETGMKVPGRGLVLTGDEIENMERSGFIKRAPDVEMTQDAQKEAIGEIQDAYGKWDRLTKSDDLLGRVTGGTATFRPKDIDTLALASAQNTYKKYAPILDENVKDPTKIGENEKYEIFGPITNKAQLCLASGNNGWCTADWGRTHFESSSYMGDDTGNPHFLLIKSKEKYGENYLSFVRNGKVSEFRGLNNVNADKTRFTDLFEQAGIGDPALGKYREEMERQLSTAEIGTSFRFEDDVGGRLFLMKIDEDVFKWEDRRVTKSLILDRLANNGYSLVSTQQSTLSTLGRELLLRLQAVPIGATIILESNDTLCKRDANGSFESRSNYYAPYELAAFLKDQQNSEFTILSDERRQNVLAALIVTRMQESAALVVRARHCEHCDEDAPDSEFFGEGEREFHRPCTKHGPLSKEANHVVKFDDLQPGATFVFLIGDKGVLCEKVDNGTYKTEASGSVAVSESERQTPVIPRDVEERPVVVRQGTHLVVKASSILVSTSNGTTSRVRLGDVRVGDRVRFLRDLETDEGLVRSDSIAEVQAISLYEPGLRVFVSTTDGPKKRRETSRTSILVPSSAVTLLVSSGDPRVSSRSALAA